MKGFRTSCSFSFPELSCRKGRLRQAALRRTASGARLSRAATPIASPSPTAASSRSTTNGVTFNWKDYRIEGRDRLKTMTLTPDEFIRRFLLHVLPDGFHRIRHFGFLANGHRTERLALCRSLLASQVEPTAHGKEEPASPEPDNSNGVDPPPCPDCGGPMRFVADLPRSGERPRSKTSSFWCDTS